MSKDQLVLFGCGDIGPIHEPVGPYSVLVKETLATADIRFGQCERLYSERGSLQLHSDGGHWSRAKPSMASVFTDCGFDVLSLASNHAMDWGEEALLDTIELFNKAGIQTVGAGRNIEEATRPVVINRNGTRVGLLAYCSVVKEGYAAGPNKSGIAPMRAQTYYETHEWQPGSAPKVVTIPHQDDLRAMTENIAIVKKTVDVVVLSMHWGIHYVPRVIADYQTAVAKAAFEAGADLILGHHAHVPKAIGVYGDKVCFYSLSNFIMTSPERAPAAAKAWSKKFGVAHDPDYPRLPYSVDGKRSLVAKAILTSNGVKEVSFMPILIDKQLRPEFLKSGDPRFDDAVRFMEWTSEDFEHKFSIKENEVGIT